MWVCIAMLCVCAIDYKTSSVCSLGTSCVCAVGSHVLAYVQARLHVSMWLQASSHTWGRVPMRMQKKGNTKRKEERWGVLTGDAAERRGWHRDSRGVIDIAVFWHGHLIGAGSGSSRTEPTELSAAQTGVSGCLHSLPFTQKHTHTHTEQHSQATTDTCNYAQ